MKMQVNVALIADEFTSLALDALCNVSHVTPANFIDVLETDKPDILFIESAWHGYQNTWFLIIQDCEPEIRIVIEAYKAANIPTVFWNKEDPIHFDLFLPTALLCDYIFTTDVSLKPLYRFHAKHDRVYALPFAASPGLHNPIETEIRRKKASFAGTYYRNFPQRAKDLDAILGALAKNGMSVDIYDRHFNDNHPDYQFPDSYRDRIVGYLPFDQIDRAYKGFEVSININTVKNSGTMMARRLFELAACNTLIVSNYSRAIRSLFGDLIVSGDDEGELSQRFAERYSDELYSERLRAMLMRQIFSRHLYKHRMARVLALALKRNEVLRPLSFSCFAYVTTQQALLSIVASFERQSYPSKFLYIFVPETLLDNHVGAHQTLCTIQQAEEILFQARERSDYFAVVSPEDYYGPHYLEDFAHMAEAAPDSVLTKACFATKNTKSWRFVGSGRPYTFGKRSVSMRRSAVPIAHLDMENILTILTEDEKPWREIEALAVGRLQYCEYGASLPEGAVVDLLDIEGLNCGNEIDYLDANVRAGSYSEDPITSDFKEVFVMQGAEMAEQIGLGRVTGYFHSMREHNNSTPLAVDVFKSGEQGLFVPDPENTFFSGIRTGEEEIFVYVNDMALPLRGALESAFYCRWEREGAETGILQSRVVFRFLDHDKKPIQTTTRSAGRYMTVPVPDRARFLQLGLRFRQQQDLRLKSIRFFAIPELQNPPMPNSNHLLITPIYPSSAHLYRGGFVHSRVLGYLKRGVETEVFRLQPTKHVACSSFEGVDIVEGDYSNLVRMLRMGAVQTLSIHFLEPSLWVKIEPYIRDMKIIIWVHGYEAQAASRRIEYFKTEEERQAHQQACDRRMMFWNRLFSSSPPNVDFVFVSETFKQWVCSDVGCLPPPKQCHVIHNVIDTDFYTFTPKGSEQRFKVLTIRPFSSSIYGNDLMVETILKMSESGDFSKFYFSIVGDGPDFDECLAPLRRFSNVSIQRGFVTRKEIRSLHREHGVFLVPTRSDTQGVSRDEAMASGLVPVTNIVGAIPEFVDDTTGILAPAEDARTMAQRILDLANSPEQFLRLSRAAAARTRLQCSPEQTLDKELALIRPAN
ncbi:glycosyltransferase family protein [Kordiimonas sp.]|uniref:glycosyltransferase n=1 Tax=Kordiimonas sp. TaxID=1970157 RepID=UPI003A949D7A